MNRTIKLKRGQKERWMCLGIILENGEPGVCFDGDDIIFKIGNGINNWCDLPTLSFSKHAVNDLIYEYLSGNTIDSTKIISFGNISDSGNMDYPVTENSTIGDGKYQRYYPDLYNNFNSVYKDFLWDIVWSDGSSGLTQRKYNNRVELVADIGNNTPNNSSIRTAYYNIECYAKQSNSVGRINKVYGMNKFLSMLKGRGNYKSRIGHLGNVYSSLRWSNKDSFISTIWDYFTFNGFTNSNNLANITSSTWIASNYHTMYGLLQNGNTITFNSGDAKNRKVFSWGDSDFYTHNVENMTVTDSVFVGLNLNATSFTLLSNTTLDNIYYSYDSLIKVYKLNGISQYGDNISALYIKPVGMDTFRLNYIPNSTSKSLYMYVYSGWNDDQPLIRKLNDVNVSVDEGSKLLGDLSYMVSKFQWQPNILYSNSRNHIGETKQKRFRFFIGDNNGNISNFSSEIAPYVYGTGTKVRTVIKGV
jgi:hypothetical protein